MQEKIIILDFGSQYTQLIARRIREQNVYCEIYAYNHIPDIDLSIKGIILSGSPCSVTDQHAPDIDLQQLKNAQVPILGICYGAQLIVHKSGGEIVSSKIREYGNSEIKYIDKDNLLLNNISINSKVLMSHSDTIKTIPSNFSIIVSTKDVEIAAYKIKDTNIYGLQFHPEVAHLQIGTEIIKNFIFKICNITANWATSDFITTSIKQLQDTIQQDNVVLGLSGGVDSTVAAVLLNRAISHQLTCIFVETGLLRKNEFEKVLKSYKTIGLNVKGIEAKHIFFSKLKNITDPEEKRKIIGSTFVEIFDAEAQKIKDVKWLAQGTIYPDVIESVSVKGPSVSIKTHHNVGGLPKNMKLKVVEPLRYLFKDEVRRIGKDLNIPDLFINRHPFPGPGLAIRVLGEVTEEKIKIIQEVDDIFINALIDANLYNEVWQAGAILLPIKSVGVMGDERTYENVVALRAVKSIDGMTAESVNLPFDFLTTLANQIINKVKGVNRVVYDLSSKPPSTIEWE